MELGLPARQHYDTIIVGAGASGSVLAATLSTLRPDERVLVLEAGPCYSTLDQVPPDVLDSRCLKMAASGHPLNWSFAVTLRTGSHTTIPRGRVMGGSSAINGCYFMRGTKEDFDSWAALGNDRWSYAEVLPHFKALEHDRDVHDTYHGLDGPVVLQRDLPALQHPVVASFFAASSALGYHAEPDKNAPGKPGVGLIPQNVCGGRRMSAAVSHLIPALANSSLEVRGNLLVHRILFSGERAVGVQLEDQTGRRHRIRADEVILSAGAVKSPHLLLLSGVGPADQLRTLGIPVVTDLPGVGTSFEDHPHVSIGLRYREQDLPATSIVPAALNLSTDAANRPGDIEIIMRMSPSGAVLPGQTGRSTFSEAADAALDIGLQQPTGRGTISLRTTDPRHSPVIEYNYLAVEEDRRRMRQGARAAVELIATGEMQRHVEFASAEVPRLFTSDAWTDEYINTCLASAAHLSCACRMGSPDEPNSVVDQFCRVYGVQGLRIVDTSIMPHIVSRGASATAFMIGRRAGYLIAEQRS